MTLKVNVLNQRGTDHGYFPKYFHRSISCIIISTLATSRNAGFPICCHAGNKANNPLNDGQKTLVVCRLPSYKFRQRFCGRASLTKIGTAFFGCFLVGNRNPNFHSINGIRRTEFIFCAFTAIKIHFFFGTKK